MTSTEHHPPAFLRAAARTLLGAAALASLMGGRPAQRRCRDRRSAARLAVDTHFPAKAKHVIYLHMVGGPSQMDLYDYKPVMNEWYDKDLPDIGPHGPAADDDDHAARRGSRSRRRSSSSRSTASAACGSASCCRGRPRWSTTCASSAACTPRRSTTSRPSRYMQTGNQITGRPCLGAWASYGLGSLNENLPTFVVLVAKPTNTEQVQAISARLWSVGLSAGRACGRARSARPAIRSCTSTIRRACRAEVRRKTLDGLKALNELNYQQVGDPETHTRIQQYELAFRMQASVPELTDLASEPASDATSSTATTAKKPGTFANTALLARRHGRAGRAVRADLPQQLGHARQRRRPAARPVPRRRSGLLRPDSGPQAARAARRDARHLGRRIRPHDLLAGRPVEGELRPRPSSALLHDVDGRRRHQGRARSTARPTTSPTTSSRTRSTSATSTPRSCTCWASTTSGSPYRYQGLDQRLTGVEPAQVIKELLA